LDRTAPLQHISFSYRGCQKNVPIEDRFSATNPYTAIIFSEHYYDKRYKHRAPNNEGDEFIERFTSAEYKAFIAEWKSLLVSFFVFESTTTRETGGLDLPQNGGKTKETARLRKFRFGTACRARGL
jgi:hypothetical protein